MKGYMGKVLVVNLTTGEIVDETDQTIDMQKVARKRKAEKKGETGE